MKHLALRHVLTHAGLEHFRAHALCLQQRLVGVDVEAAVRLLQRGQLRNRQQFALQSLVARHQVQLVGRRDEHAIAHQAVEHLLLHLRRVEELGVDAGHLAAHALDLLALRGVPLGLRDVVAIDLGHRGVLAAGEAAVTLDTEEHERRKDQEHQDELQQPGVLADEIEHREPLSTAVKSRCNKGEPGFALESGELPGFYRRPRGPTARARGAFGGC